MKTFIIFLLVMGFGIFTRAQVLDNAEKAFQLAKESQKPILLVFSGSDWCAPCIRFQKNVLSQESFIHYASDHFIILKADFPQRKKLPAMLKEQNEQLAERYNPNGQFPHIILLNPDQKILKTLHFNTQNAEGFILELSPYFAE